ncbi:unnamed protein product, partial [Sphacelaria rigidula]
SDATSSALYLRTLLRALDWAAVNGYDVRALLDESLEATSIGALYNVFLDSVEAGNHPTEASKLAAQEATEADGGVVGLRNAFDALTHVAATSPDDKSRGCGWEGTEPRVSTLYAESGVTRKRVVHAEQEMVNDNCRAGKSETQRQQDNNTGGDGKHDGHRAEADITMASAAPADDGCDVSGEYDNGGEDDSEDDGGGYSDEEYDDDEDEFEVNDKGNGSEEKRRKKPGTPNTRARELTPTTDVIVEQHGDSPGGAKSEDNGSRDASNSQGLSAEEAQPTSCGEATCSELTCARGLELARGRGLDEVPLYFLGGAEVEGFGVMVGRAVALLHVVRHGLRAEELWSLLAALKASTSAQEKAEGTEGEAESRLLRKLLKNQNRLIDSIRSMDSDRDGVISIEEFRTAVEALGVGLTDDQMETLIRSIDVDNDRELGMQEMVERFSTTARKMRRGVVATSRG